jgi:hypothetical protein
VIVVVGQLYYRETEAGPDLDGLPARIALAAAAAGRPVQVVGKVGEDPAGDAVVLALARGGVGHVALLRDAGRGTPLTRAADDEALVPDDEAPEASPAPATTGAVPAGSPALVPALDAADVELALRYLTEFGVLVLAERCDPGVVRVASDAVAWAGASLIALVPAGETDPAGLPADAIVFEAPDDDPDGVFAATVGAFAAALDEGDDPASAFRASVETGGWTRAATD